MSDLKPSVREESFFDLEITEEDAARYQVEPRVHRNDFIFVYHFDGHDKRTPREAAAIYFSDGFNSTERLDKLIRTFLPDRRNVRLLEFASGYGCLTRHLKKLDGMYGITACDIHPQAVAFIRDIIGVEAVLSDRIPEKMVIGDRFDVVFALSFFSHMPPTTFKRWVNVLLDHVEEGGLLIFTTHGRTGQAAIGVPSLGESGFWFAASSEQRDLPTADYGTMLVRPHFAFDAVADRTDCTLLLFQEAFWWGVQDIYVYRKLSAGMILNRNAAPDGASALRASVADLRVEVDLLRNSTCWKATAPARAVGRFLRRPR